MRNESSHSSYRSGVAAVAPAPLRARLWIICDEGAALAELKSLLCEEETMMTKWTELLAIPPILPEVEIIVVDVAPIRLAELLRILREDLACEQSIILVNHRVNAELQPCGLLPCYRAMMCAWKDVVRLVRNRLQGTKTMPSASALL